MEILDLRHVASRDLRPLLEDETRRWRDLLRWDYRGAAEMILRYVDNRVLPGFAATVEGRLIGYSFYLYESGKAIVGDAYVESRVADPEPVVRSLLEHSLDVLQATPGAMRIESQLLLLDGALADGAFVDAGFACFPRRFLSLPLPADAADPEDDVGPDFVLQGWEKKRYQEAARLIVDAYEGHIDAEINEQYGSVGGALRFLNNIVLFPGCGYFDAKASVIVIERASNEMVGLLLCSRVDEGVGHITQICLRPSCRGRGLGAAMLRRCRRRLRQMGFFHVTLTVTESNLPAMKLYAAMGFQTLHAFDAFVWQR